LLLGGLCLGLGLGTLTRALGAKGRGETRLAARRSSAAATILALAVVAAIGFLVLPGRAAGRLPEATTAAYRVFLLPGLGVLALGLIVGLLPRAVGIPLCIIMIAFTFALLAGLADWLASGSAREIAVLTPFSVEAGSFSGELAVTEKDSVPIQQEISLPATGAGLAIERLELDGFLGLCRGRSFYRLAGIVGERDGEETLIDDFRRPTRMLDLVLPLDDSLDAATSLPFARRWREATAIHPLIALEPLRFSLDPEAPAGSGLRLQAGSAR